MQVDAETEWEVSHQSKRHKAACYVCNAVFAPDALRLRPSGTTRTRLLHPACAGGHDITMEKVTNLADMSVDDRSHLQSHLAHAARAPRQPGDAPAVELPSRSELTNLELFDSIPWDRCLECYRCIRAVPPHWTLGIWEARAAVLRAIISANEQTDALNSERLWKLLSLLDAMLLSAAPHRHAGRRGQGRASLNQILSKRLRAFWSGAWHQLLFDADSAIVPTRLVPQEQSEEARINREAGVVQQLAHNGALSKAISRITEPLVFATGPDVVEKVQAKFITAAPNQPMDLPVTTATTLDELENHIAEELQHLPPMRSAGPTGTTYEHLRPSAGITGCSHLLAKVLAMLPAAIAPAEAMRIHRSARICAPLKRDHRGQLTDDIRPLAGGSALWRVAMRGWARMFKTEVMDVVGPTQYGVGRPGGCTSLRHDLLVEWMLNPGHVLLGIDLENMHNSIRTGYLTTEIVHKIPRMAELLHWLSVPRTHVFVDEHGVRHRIDAADGLDQGCPASNLLAPVAIVDAHDQLKAFGAVFGQQDDTYVLADPLRMPDLCDALPPAFAPTGTHVKVPKCFVSAMAPCSTGSSGIPFVTSPVVLRLPMPIPDANGDIGFDMQPTTETIATREGFLERLLHLRHAGVSSQIAFLIARTATDGDTNYLCQCMPVPHHAAAQLDRILLDGIYDLLSIDPAHAAGMEARWFSPWRDGGMGLQSVVHCASPLFMASAMRAASDAAARHGLPTAETLMQKLPGFAHLLTEQTTAMYNSGIGDAASLNDLFAKADSPKLVASWRLSACARSISLFDSGADSEAVVTRKESSGTGAAAWLMAPTEPAHRMTDQAFVTSVRLRLHLPVFSHTGVCAHTSKKRRNLPSQACGCQRDAHGKHALLCQVGGYVVARHNRLRDVLADEITDATGSPAATEQHDAAAPDDRRPDINYMDWRGDMVHIDVEVVTPHAMSRGGGGDGRQVRAGALVASGEALKRRKYAHLRLMPAVTSHLGRAGEDLISLIRSLHRNTDPEERSQAIAATWHKWSCTLQRWNCHLLGSAGPLLPP